MKRNLIHVFTTVLFIVALAGTKSNAGVQQHLVQKGDTLWGLSRKYKVPLKSIAQANRIKLTKRLQIGEKLLIPWNIYRRILGILLKQAIPCGISHAAIMSN